jgi:hypothetical protein
MISNGWLSPATANLPPVQRLNTVVLPAAHQKRKARYHRQFMLVLEAVYLANVCELSDVFHVVEADGRQCDEVSDMRETYVY